MFEGLQMRHSYPSSQGPRHRLARLMVLASALLLAPHAVESQTLPQSRQPNSPRSDNANREMSAEDVFRRFSSRILFLTCDVSDDESTLASGVVVSEDGFVVTNSHVVEGCRTLTATYMNRGVRNSFVATLRYYDRTTDTAVLNIGGGKSWDYFPVAARSVRIGERVFAIGNPRGFEQSITDGIVSGEREADGASWIQHSAPISPGSSGGALISSRGELLGINSRTRKDSQNLNFAVPAAMLAHALKTGRERVVYLGFPPAQDDLVSMTSGQIRALTTEAGQGDADRLQVLIDAAELGNVEAQVMLSGLYLIGYGVPRDHAMAAKWIRRAAYKQDARAEFSLGKMYATCDAVPQDYTQAAAWYRRAADHGWPSAQLSLGVTYLNGDGVPQDFLEAYFWVKVAAAGVVPDTKPEDIAAVLNLLIAPHLTALEIAEEQRRARNWLAARDATPK